MSVVDEKVYTTKLGSLYIKIVNVGMDHWQWRIGIEEDSWDDSETFYAWSYESAARVGLSLIWEKLADERAELTKNMKAISDALGIKTEEDNKSDELYRNAISKLRGNSVYPGRYQA